MSVTAGMLLGQGAKDFIGFIHPDGDTNTSGWGATPLWQKISKTRQSEPDDATTELTSTVNAAVCPTNQDRIFEISLQNPGSTPTGNETQVFRFRIWLHVVNGSADTRQLRVELRQGGTQIAVIAGTLSTSSYVTFSKTLTQGEKDSITDYNNLRIWCRTRVCMSGFLPSSHGHCTWAEMEFS